MVWVWVNRGQINISFNLVELDICLYFSYCADKSAIFFSSSIMSNMIESILVNKNNTDCTSFHHFYVLIILESEIPFLKLLQIPFLGLTRLNERFLSWLFSRETVTDKHENRSWLHESWPSSPSDEACNNNSMVQCFSKMHRLSTEPVLIIKTVICQDMHL